MKHILDSIDEFLDSQKEQEQKVFMFLPALVFGFLIYYILYPITEEMSNESETSYLSTKEELAKIKQNNTKLQTNNLKIKTSIKKEKQSLKEIEKEKLVLDKILNTIQFLKFDLDKWADFYNDIPALSKVHNISLEVLKNELRLEDTKELIQNKMSINIVAEGSFVNFLRFINEFEKKKALVKVKSLKIEQNFYNRLIALKQKELEMKVKTLLFKNDEDYMKLEAIKSLKKQIDSFINTQKYKTIVESINSGKKEMNSIEIAQKLKELEFLEKKELEIRKKLDAKLELVLYNLFQKKEKERQLNQLVSSIVDLDERVQIKKEINDIVENLKTLIKKQEENPNKLNLSIDIYGAEL